MSNQNSFEMMQMFAEYNSRTGVIQELESRLENQKNVLSSLVKKIRDQCGPGPFTVNDKVLYIYNRGETWFFSGQRGRGKK